MNDKFKYYQDKINAEIRKKEIKEIAAKAVEDCEKINEKCFEDVIALIDLKGLNFEGKKSAEFVTCVAFELGNKRFDYLKAHAEYLAAKIAFGALKNKVEQELDSE